ncbi:MAG: hypothetical protein AAFR23_05980, partial [Pseudomonadota bacterium]
RPDLRLHFAKTGTQVNIDPDETVDVWATGGLQFTNGAAYSYVVMVGSGTPSRPFARSLHSSQIAAPLLNTLLRDLAGHAKRNPVRPVRLPPVAVRRTAAPGTQVARRSSDTASRIARKRVAKTTHKKPNPFGSRRNAKRKRQTAFSVESVFKELAGR